jgi:predicted small lipoprotein YifL
MHRFTSPLLIALAVAITLTGCNDHSPPTGPPMAKPYPVHGRITFPDQSPLRGGVVYFTPTEVVTEDDQVRYETASLVDAQGKFKLGFNGDQKGAPPGECKVTVQPRDCQELPRSNSKQIPGKYRDPAKTPLKVTVKESDNTINIVLK